MSCSEAEAGANINKIIPERKLKYVPYILSSHALNEAVFYIVVFKPLDKPYNKDPEWFRFKGLDKCRQKLPKADFLVLTREITSAKVHINALIHTRHDISKFHNKVYLHKYKMYVSEVKDAAEDRLRVLDYIFKENARRSFLKYKDYIEYLPPEYSASI